jgi:hypothetical protein
MLTFLTPFIIGFKWGYDEAFSTLGVLEVLWLSRHAKKFEDAREYVSTTEVPTSENLRKAAMVGGGSHLALSQRIKRIFRED